MSAPPADLAAVLAHLRSHEAAFEDRFAEFLRIPSVSTSAEHADDVARAAEWVAQHARGSGLTAEVVTHESGLPATIVDTPADRVASPDAPALLFYGHHDVQPAQRHDGWSSEPFEPVVRDGQAFARGASDDKAGVLSMLEAVRAYHDADRKLPCRVRMLIEGEEEIGSPTLAGMIQAHAERLRADVAVVCDTAMWDYPGQDRAPDVSITLGLRGLAYFDLRLDGPSRDLHSGVYGGAIANPATELARTLGALFDDHRRLTLPGLDEHVDPVDPDEAASWDQLGFDDQAFAQEVGATLAGEAGRPTLERRWARIACDVNGLWGGFAEPGAKTIIPAAAGAKVSFRLPASVDPKHVDQAFRAWLQARDVGGCRWTVTQLGLAEPFLMRADSPWIQTVRNAVLGET
ncbi:MAG: M20/M25/M40 family metallo-hydrolase, partial [Planctomycetota bacterium]